MEGEAEISKTEKIYKYLKERPNQPFTMRSLSLDLGIDKMMVSGIVDALCFFGKITMVRRIIRGNYVCVESDAEKKIENLPESAPVG